MCIFLLTCSIASRYTHGPENAIYVGVVKRSQPQDIYDISGLNCWNLQREYFRINKLLTNDEHADHFDAVLERLIVDMKQNESLNSIGAKRLFLTLNLLKKNLQCNSFSYRILTLNHCANNFRIGELNKGDNWKRNPRPVDVILSEYIYQHANDCQNVYQQRFRETVASMDMQLVTAVEALLDDLIEETISDKFAPNRGKSLIERYFNIVSSKLKTRLYILPDYVYNKLKVLAKNDSSAKFLSKTSEYRPGLFGVNKLKFSGLYQKYISEPCAYYRNKLGDEIFIPASFDVSFKHNIMEEDVEFYKGWTMFKFCSVPGLDESLLLKTIALANRT